MANQNPFGRVRFFRREWRGLGGIDKRYVWSKISVLAGISGCEKKRVEIAGGVDFR